jgi:starch synthase
MRILMAASEMAPLASTGGLGEFLELLPKALADRGHDVSVALPFYRTIREFPKLKPRSTGVQLTVPVGQKRVETEILEAAAPNGVQLFLVRRDETFDRSGLYGIEGRAYDDTAERFIFFSKAVAELARHLTPAPDILHCHDWHTALAPVVARLRSMPFKTVLTVHDLAFQGSFWAVDFALTNLPPEYFGPKGVEFHGSMNLLKGGIIAADAVTVCGERYARAIQTPQCGFGLDGILREHSRKVTGILGGIDDAEWNPAKDPGIAKKYRSAGSPGKAACREALLAELGLAKKPAGPVFALYAGPDDPLTIPVLLPLLDRMLADDVRVILRVAEPPRHEKELAIASKRHRERFALVRADDIPLLHRVLAGADSVILAHHGEPGDETALRSLRYGLVPVARAAGGLHQLIRDFDPTTGEGNGFLYFDDWPEALWDAVGRAKKAFARPEEWRELADRSMAEDRSWARAAAEYEALYARLTGG